MRHVAAFLILMTVAAVPASADPPRRWGGVVRWHGGYRAPRVQVRWRPYWVPVAPYYRPRVLVAPPPLVIVRRPVYRQAPPPRWEPAPPPQWEAAPPPEAPEPYYEGEEGQEQPAPPCDVNPPAPYEEPPPAQAPLPPQGDALELEVARLVNVERARAGLGELVPNELLSDAARAHSEEMIRLGYFNHQSPVPANRTMTDRMRNAGIVGFGQAGENIAMGTFSPRNVAAELVRAWMESEGHRRNILEPGVRFIGVGVAWRGGEVFATQLFTRTVEVRHERAPAPPPAAPPEDDLPPDSAAAPCAAPPGA